MTKVKASPEPPLPAAPAPHDAAVDIAQPASNATRQLEKPRVRQKASADQSILQEKGADALPVSDYPLKEGSCGEHTGSPRTRTRKDTHTFRFAWLRHDQFLTKPWHWCASQAAKACNAAPVLDIASFVDCCTATKQFVAGKFCDQLSHAQQLRTHCSNR